MIPNYCDLLQQEEESQNAVSPFSPGPGRDLQDYSLSAVQLQSDERGHGLFPYKILGLESQSVEIDLRPGTLLKNSIFQTPTYFHFNFALHFFTGEGIRADVGSLIWMSEGVEMETQTGGGISKVCPEPSIVSLPLCP